MRHFLWVLSGYKILPKPSRTRYRTFSSSLGGEPRYQSQTDEHGLDRYLLTGDCVMHVWPMSGGGFANVYRGVYLPTPGGNFVDVAVKCPRIFEVMDQAHFTRVLQVRQCYLISNCH